MSNCRYVLVNIYTPLKFCNILVSVIDCTEMRQLNTLLKDATKFGLYELTRSVNKLILSQPAKSHIQDYVQGFIIN